MYTIHTPNSDINDNNAVTFQTDQKNTKPNGLPKIESNTLVLSNDDDQIYKVSELVDNDNYENDKKVNDTSISNQECEEFQKQTFLTDILSDEHENDQINDCKTRQELHEADLFECNTRQELHEAAAKRKEEIRTKYNRDKREEENLAKLQLVPLNISVMDEIQGQSIEYTIDDIVQHNTEAGRDWFKYGKKIYSWKKMLPIIQSRIDQYAQKAMKTSTVDLRGYPVYIARKNGVTRKELEALLQVCLEGFSVDVPLERYLSLMKKDAEIILQEKSESEEFRYYIEQLSRWLSNYSVNNMYNEPPPKDCDTNLQSFPLPADILADPTVLRKWIETWTPFEIPEGNAWEMIPLINDDLGETHVIFASSLRPSDEGLQPFDMAIDGAVAWTEIECDLFKLDKTTETQDMTWKQRQARRTLNDPVWMAKRREALARMLKARYNQMKKSYPVENYMDFADILEKNWKTFLDLCEKEFISHKQTERNIVSVKNERETKANEDSEVEYNNVDLLHLDQKDDYAEDRGKCVLEKDMKENKRDSNKACEGEGRLDLGAVSEHNINGMVELEKMDSGLELDGVVDQVPNN